MPVRICHSIVSLFACIQTRFNCKVVLEINLQSYFYSLISFVPRYDQAGCGVDKDHPHYDAKNWTSWRLKPASRGTVLRERLWQCCLGGGKKAAEKYRSGQARNTSKIGCPRSLYAVTRWDSEKLKARSVEIYFKHQHLRECFEHGLSNPHGANRCSSPQYARGSLSPRKSPRSPTSYSSLNSSPYSPYTSHSPTNQMFYSQANSPLTGQYQPQPRSPLHQQMTLHDFRGT
jgi:hypothetical protein